MTGALCQHKSKLAGTLRRPSLCCCCCCFVAARVRWTASNRLCYIERTGEKAKASSSPSKKATKPMTCGVQLRPEIIQGHSPHLPILGLDFCAVSHNADPTSLPVQPGLSLLCPMPFRPCLLECVKQWKLQVNDD